ncbi:transglutaminase-like domain-containing protein [Clostridium tagluense]|uniref:transglutaminase domain-containing protein n=1 Tax=Clostridium tagluense TaxID=360422 RepID=UPI001C0C74C9|nr:transglutaminase domain-containing protein [Clostridium tagluense]MBU3128138.1 transglutaminase-like domain-containing protein [Clostridium tagluense]MCB2311725.1 transglutaminase-like domain-containing protein [Clostridium tagluense]MCB2316553.1 transglutaminase-like domain-containing protein [Clostridium tagluense]MCB2321305.1 transglutaminase-like domain-containing protein [Clostridium tagluense]MCB2326422.1 transglutaminase-like domain-containing protein [Clostridium tagluense]
MFREPVTLILLLLFIYPVIKGFIFKFSSENLKGSIQGAFQSISFLSALFLGIYYTKKIFIQHNEGIYEKIYKNIPLKAIDFINNKPLVIYVLLMPLVVLIIYTVINFVINLISHITIYPLFDSIENKLKNKSDIFKRVVGAIFQVPKSICYVIVITLMLNFLSLLKITDAYNKYLEGSQLYNYISKEVVIPLTNSKLAKQLPNIVNNSFKIVVKEASAKDSNVQNKQKVITYYNGVTLDQGVQSNGEIDKFAIKLVQNKNATREKAKLIYNWVGSEVVYDDAKANRVLNNDLEVKSGAVPTFDSKSGICFDYACLFVAMCRANNIKVRIITGQGFNGNNWVSHAWNQVYIEDENKWINVDPTFLIGGDYFDSKRFVIDHKEESIAGEW